MNCPEHLVIGKGGFYVWMYYRDVPRHTIPVKVWLNPLRYQISFNWNGKRIFKINPYGSLAGKPSRWFRNLFRSKT